MSIVVYRMSNCFMGGYVINYFMRFGRQWQVYIEAESEDRPKAENVGDFHVRNNKGENVPLSTLARVEPRLGPGFILRFYKYLSSPSNCTAPPGYRPDQTTRCLNDG